MKITIEKAIGMFTAVKTVSYKEVKVDKVSLIWLRLYPVVKEWENLQEQIRKDVEEAKKPFTDEFNALTEEEKKVKGADIDKKFREAINDLTSVKAQQTLLKEEREVDLPTLTEEEFLAISKSSAFESIGDAGILFDLVEK